MAWTSSRIVALALVVVFLAAAASARAAQQYALTPSGYGGGGRFTCVEIVAQEPSRVYVGSDVAGFFVSEDGGQSFTARGRDLGSLAVADIAVPPGLPDHVVLLAHDGLYYSTDRGTTFERLSRKIRHERRFFGSDLIVFAPDGSFYVASDIDGVYRMLPPATHPGQWVMEPLLGLGGYPLNSLALSGDELFAGGDDGIFHWDRNYWDDVEEGLPRGRDTIADMTTLPDGTVVLVERHTGAYVWQPESRSWRHIGPRPGQLPGKGEVQFKAVSAAPHDSDTIFLATHPQYWPFLLLRTTDRGAEWKVITRFALTSPTSNWADGLQAVESLDFGPDGRQAMLTDWWNVWRSLDGGLSWVQVHEGLQNTVVNDIALQPGNPEHVFLAVSDNGVMISRDAGGSWTRSMEGVQDGHSRALAFSPTDPDTLYMALQPWEADDEGRTVRFHIYKSRDAGATWTHFPITDRKKPITRGYVDGQPTNLAVSPTDGDVVFVAVNGYGIYRLDTSPPEGAGEAMVENVGSTLPRPYIKGPGALVLHPEDPDVIYAGVQDGGVYKTVNGGKDWKMLQGTGGFIFGMAMAPEDPEHLLAGAGDYLLHSKDGGASWDRLTLPIPVSPRMAVNAVAFGEGGRIMAGVLGFDNLAGQGVFVSADGGQSFQKAQSDTAAVGVNVIRAIPGAPGQAYVGYNGLGLYRLAPGP